MRSLLQDNPGRKRIISGIVGSNGAILEGVGFMVVKSGVGLVSVVYLERFEVQPDVTATIFQNAAYGVIMTGNSNVSTNFVTLILNSGSGVDSGFHFIANGFARRA